MEKTKLEEFNHWWMEGKVDSELALEFKREEYDEIEKHLEKKFITALVGLRRVGKTTIMYQLIQKLLKSVNKENIVFFSFDESSVKLNDVIETYKEIQKKEFRKEKIYIFLDEIQKCDNWGYEIKIKPYFLKFVERGGFPETFSFENDRDFKEYIRALVEIPVILKRKSF